MAFKMSSVCFAEAVALGFFPDAPSADFCSRMERVRGVDGRKRGSNPRRERGTEGSGAFAVRVGRFHGPRVDRARFDGRRVD